MKKYSSISYLALSCGLISLLFFIPAINNNRFSSILLWLSGLGILLAIISLWKKNEKKTVPVIALLCSLLVPLTVLWMILALG